MMNRIAWIGLTLALLSLNACNKDGDKELIQAAAQDLAEAEDLFSQDDLDMDMAVEDRGGSADCPTVTPANPWGVWPNTIAIDYGPDGCTRADGRVVKGKVIVTQSAPLWTANCTRNITYENYFVDDVQIEGSRTWINNGLNAEGQWNFTRNIQGMKLSYPDGTSITWNRSNTVTLIAGGNTPNILIDDVWSSVGEAGGTNRKGESFSAQIVKPLIKRNNCRWISEGVIELTRGGASGTLDYGAGLCDRFATLTTAGGDAYTVRLRR